MDATVEARDNDDALRLVGKKMLASADQTGSPADSHLTEPLNYWIKVVPEEALNRGTPTRCRKLT